MSRAVELGHTFNLGTRYSESLGAVVDVPSEKLGKLTTETKMHASTPLGTRIPMHMGCHGIGVSRIIGAVADILADDKGLNWPKVLAPFEGIIIASDGLENVACSIYDLLKSHRYDSHALDIVIDDRESVPLVWKLKDADLIGYPIIIVIGQAWKRDQRIELQCRRRKEIRMVNIDSLAEVMANLLKSLSP